MLADRYLLLLLPLLHHPDSFVYSTGVSMTTYRKASAHLFAPSLVALVLEARARTR